MHRYTVRRPISSDPALRRQGSIIAEHDSLPAARATLDQQRRGATKRGGYSQDYIWDEAEGHDIA